jgi:hypothetical protein
VWYVGPGECVTVPYPESTGCLSLEQGWVSGVPSRGRCTSSRGVVGRLPEAMLVGLCGVLRPPTERSAGYRCSACPSCLLSCGVVSCRDVWCVTSTFRWGYGLNEYFLSWFWYSCNSSTDRYLLPLVCVWLMVFYACVGWYLCFFVPKPWSTCRCTFL